MLHSLVEHFLNTYPALVAYHDAMGPQTVTALLGAIPQADNAFNRFFNRG